MNTLPTTTQINGLSPYMHRVARGLMRLGGWHGSREIERACGDYREHVLVALRALRAARLVVRRPASNLARNACEYRMTTAGIAFAMGPEPGGNHYTTEALRYDHRALAAALGMNRTVTPPAGRVHHLEGGR